ncbi:MAG: hypothetical protein ACE5EX_03910 [Phycisphaerae bacterium]
MTARRARRRWYMVALLGFAVACARPQWSDPWPGATDAGGTVAGGDRELRTLYATGRILMTSDRGTVELTGVVVAQPPDRVRVRAWKRSSAVFDITLNPDGLYVYHPRGRRDHGLLAQRLTRQHLVEVVSRFPSLARRPRGPRGRQPQPVGSIPARRVPTGNGETNSGEAQAPTEFAFRDTAGRIRHTLRCRTYRRFGDIEWPMRVEARGDDGSVEFLFDRVQINRPLPERAFVPPRRATRQP